MVSRSAFAFLTEGAAFRAGRLYETFWNSQSNLKYGLVVVWPAYLFYIRWRAETQYKYNVYIADKSVYPTYKHKSGVGHFVYSTLFGNGWAEQGGGGYWSNGKVFYGTEKTTVEELKKVVYDGEPAPEGLRVGCRGRMFENSDNLALAVKNFCRRDPRVLMWTE